MSDRVRDALVKMKRELEERVVYYDDVGGAEADPVGAYTSGLCCAAERMLEAYDAAFTAPRARRRSRR